MGRALLVTGIAAALLASPAEANSMTLKQGRKALSAWARADAAREGYARYRVHDCRRVGRRAVRCTVTQWGHPPTSPSAPQIHWEDEADEGPWETSFWAMARRTRSGAVRVTYEHG